MSPLVRSLLALAALLAAAVAQYGPCDEVLIGQQTSIATRIHTVDVPPGGGRISVPDYCGLRGLTLVGEDVKACNKDPSGVKPVVRPTDQSNPHMPVDVICPYGCPYGVIAYIFQYCR